MARKNNKGFSLVEVVVAVAILTLLLSPIIIQLAQTLRTSSEAKERQYAIEDAQHTMEYFQKIDKTMLDTHLSEGSVQIQSSSTTTVTCTVYDNYGNYIKTVDYHVTDYVLEDTQLGKKKNTYQRTVTIDDLSNKLLENDLSVRYEFTDAQVANLESNRGLTRTNEGSMVKYDANNHVVEVACNQNATPSGYKDPNTVEIGFIQDLDASKVAIIQGNASNFDSKAETEFFSLKMQHLKQLNPEAYQQAMEHIAGDNIFTSSSFVESVSKMTVISITYDINTTSYIVSCDVFYEDNYTLSGQSIHDELTYNVYSQAFKTNRSPDIYFIYEPFVDIATRTTVQYSTNDYIIVHNDQESQESKLYMIKPDNSQLVVKSATSGVDTRVYYTRVSGNYTPVTVNINRVSAPGAEPLYIYTNLLLNGTAEENRRAGVNASGVYNTTGNVINQFNLAQNAAVPSTKTPAGLSRAAYPDDHLLRIEDDTVISERLFTVTVNLTRVSDGVVIRFSGAKGAD